MRRIFALLMVAVIIAIALRRESAPTPTDTTTPPTSTAPAPVGTAPAPASDAPATATAAPTTSTRSGKGFRDRAHLDEHFAKHGSEFPGLTKAQYLAKAQTLRDAPVGGNILEIIRASDGVASRFDKKSGAFLAFDRDGTIRTFFKPNDGEQYFRRQAKRAPSQ